MKNKQRSKSNFDIAIYEFTQKLTEENAKFFIEVPYNVLDEFKQRIKPWEIQYTKSKLKLEKDKSKMLFLVGLIYLHIETRTPDYFTEGYVHVSSQLMYDFIYNYKDYISTLITCGIIYCDEDFAIGRKYKGFAFSFELFDEFELIELNHRPIRIVKSQPEKVMDSPKKQVVKSMMVKCAKLVG